LPFFKNFVKELTLPLAVRNQKHRRKFKRIFKNTFFNNKANIVFSGAFLQGNGKVFSKTGNLTFNNTMFLKKIQLFLI